MTTLERNVEEALTSADDIRWIRGYLRGLLDAGIPRETLEEMLQGIYVRNRDEGSEAVADLVLDGLDLLAGWCGPGLGIRESSASAG
jgi:hypothetical protein